MTATPWGDVRELSSSRSGTVSDRTRIYAAMTTAVGERGYAGIRLADVIELSGVSRSAFEDLFEGQHDCFVQTVGAVLALTERAMDAELQGEEPWDIRLRRSFQALADLVVAQSAAARACLVEAYVAGPDAVARVDRTAAVVGGRALAVLEQSPERAGIPHEIAGPVLGGLRKIIQTRLYTGRESELPRLASELMDWALGYRTPPVALRRPLPAVPAAEPEPCDPSDTRQRIVEAVVDVVAEQGYRKATVAAVAAAASISPDEFHARFDDKESAFVAALDDAALRVLKVALSGYRRAESWQQGVHHGVGAVLSFLSSDPTTTRFLAQTVWGGPEVMKRFDAGTSGFRALLAGGLKTRSSTSGLVSEAIGSSLLALVYGVTVTADPERLYELMPSAVFIALAPSVGSIEACAMINGR